MQGLVFFLHPKNTGWNIVMDDWNKDERSLSKWQWLQQHKFVIPIYFILPKTTSNVGLTFSVSDTIIHGTLDWDVWEVQPR